VKKKAEILPEDLCGHEWAEWYRMTPRQRWNASLLLWEQFILLGGSLDPEPDTQSPFFDPDEWSEISSHGRSGMHIIRRGGV
jgi:hypothetical protein